MKTKTEQIQGSPRRWRSRLGCAAAVACLSFTALGGASSVQAADKDLGMLSRLPADTELYIGFHGIAEHVEGMMESNIGKTIIGQIERQNGGLPWEENEDAKMAIQMAESVFGQEFFIAFAKGTSEQSANLMDLMSLMQETQLENMGRMFRSFGLDQTGGVEFADIFNKHADRILPMLEKAEIPPMLIGFKMGIMKDTILEQIDAMEGQLPEFIEISEVPIPGGIRMNSWTLEAKTVLGPDQREQIIDVLGPRNGKRVFQLLGEKTVEICHGMVDDYMLISVGTDHGHVKLVKDPAKSLAGTPEMQQLKEFFGKKVFNVMYASKTLQDSFNTGDPMAQVWKIAEAFGTKANMLTDSTVLREGIASLVKQGESLFAYEFSSFAGIMMWDEGLRFEAVGGSALPSIDFNNKLEFLPLVDDDTFISINAAANPEYNKAIFKYVETIFDTAIGTVDQLVDGENTREVKKGVALARKDFFGHGKEVYESIKSLTLDGLGNEQAILIDLKGTMPKIPNTPLPTEFFKHGKIPRIAVVNKVKSRKAVADSWDRMVPALSELLEKVPTDNGQGIPFPDFLSTDKNGLTTYFYPFPFTSNNCLPSVSISDDLFFLSTSKDFSEAIAAKVKANAATDVVAKESRSGWSFRMNFAPLHAAAKDWMKLVEENISELAQGNESRIKEFQRERPMILKVMELAESIRSLEIGAHKDGEWLRSSMHFKMNDFPSVLVLE